MPLLGPTKHENRCLLCSLPQAFPQWGEGGVGKSLFSNHIKLTFHRRDTAGAKQTFY